MELSNTRIVPASPSTVWEALNDPAVLKDCVPGCESFERSGENAYQLVMSARVGPVAARFNGRMTMTDLDPPHGYTLHFEGQGGAAGFARGNARVTLAPEGEQHTSLTYSAKAQVGGKLAQVGSRLIDGVAAKMSDEFFSRFGARFTPPQTPVAGTATIAAPSPPAAADVKQENATLTPPGGSQWIRYAAILALVVVLIVLYARGYR
jgi:carbon monoxide dehydrogenase subunit G